MAEKSARRTVWQSPKSWRLEVAPVERPDGTVEEKGYIRHPGAVVLVPLTAGREVLMLRQYRPALDQAILEVPAGTRGWREAWLPCAQRELREETGYRAEKVIPLGEIWPAPGSSDELMRLYLALELMADPLPADFDEEIEVVSMPLDTVVALALDGRLRDGKSIAAVLRASHYLTRMAP